MRSAKGAKRFGVVGVAGVALGFGAACNFIVADALSDYKPIDTQTFCSFDLPDGSFAECDDCIQKECAAELSKSCSVTKESDRKTWFADLKACAKNPDRGSSTPCTKIETAPDVAASASGDDADRLRAFNCVRNKCLQPLKVRAACRTCVLESTGGTAVKLSASTCGKCLERECRNEIVRYCETSQTTGDGGVKIVGTATFLDCVASDQPRVNSCVAALQNAPSTLPPDAGSDKEQDYALRSCGNRCITSVECP